MSVLPPRKIAALCLLAFALTSAFTWPLVPRIGEVGRVNSGDGRWSIWVVSWVAHALTDRRARLLDANIFHPERKTLTYSEGNFVAGAVAVPVWLATRNPYAAHNFVVAVSFTASVLGAFALAWYLTRRTSAALLAGVLYGFCPYVFAHTAHIQLLITAGLPVALVLLHELVDRPRVGTALLLGLTLSAQSLACAYYGILAGLIVGAGVLFFAATRRLWTGLRWWALVGLAAAVAVAATLPFFLPYISHRASTGFGRSLIEAATYAATWRAYLASSAWAYRWMVPMLGPVPEALFPGLVGPALAGVAVWAAARGRLLPSHVEQGFSPAGSPHAEQASRAGDVAHGLADESPALRPDVVFFYVLVVLLVGWASLGPAAGLYTLLFETIPLFGFLRAPGRFGIGVLLGFAVLAAIGNAWLQARWPRRAWCGWIAVAVAAAELFVAPLPLPPAQPLPSAYRLLARLPRGPVVEMPFYESHLDFHRHTYYMLNSTSHWRPLVNGYSDYASPVWVARASTLRGLPSPESLALLHQLRVRYIVFHGNLYSRRERQLVMERFTELAKDVRLHGVSDDVWLYELTQ